MGLSLLLGEPSGQKGNRLWAISEARLSPHFLQIHPNSKWTRSSAGGLQRAGTRWTPAIAVTCKATATSALLPSGTTGTGHTRIKIQPGFKQPCSQQDFQSYQQPGACPPSSIMKSKQKSAFQKRAGKSNKPLTNSYAARSTALWQWKPSAILTEKHFTFSTSRQPQFSLMVSIKNCSSKQHIWRKNAPKLWDTTFCTQLLKESLLQISPKTLKLIKPFNCCFHGYTS